MNAKFIHNRKNKLNSNGEALVQLEIYASRSKRILKSTTVYLAPQFWDKQKQKVKRLHPNFDALNSMLNFFRSQWERCILKQEVNNGFVDWDQIRNMNNTSENVQTCFIDFFENTIIPISNIDLKKSTNTTYKTVLMRLKEFHIGGLLPISNVNVEFCQKFNSFLSEKNISQNTRNKYFNRIKKALNEAIKRGLIKTEDCPFTRGFKVRYNSPEKKALTICQLKKIEEITISNNEALQQAKDMFLFSCYTAVRFSDLIRLSFDNFIEKENELSIRFVQEKTNKKVQYNLSKMFLDENKKSKPEQIIRRYFEKYNYARSAPSKTIHFFNSTNQNYNRLLKDIASLADINEPISSHYGRHTGITILINDAKIPVQDVQKIAGHSKIETTMGYFDHKEKDINRSLDNAYWQ